MTDHDSDPFANLESLNMTAAPSPKLDQDGTKTRKHERYHLGIIQGDRLAEDFDHEVSASRYGLSGFHASLISGKTKDEIVADVESAIADLFPMEPTSKSKMATHRYIRIGALLLAAQKSGKTEEESILALLG